MDGEDFGQYLTTVVPPSAPVDDGQYLTTASPGPSSIVDHRQYLTLLESEAPSRTQDSQKHENMEAGQTSVAPDTIRRDEPATPDEDPPDYCEIGEQNIYEPLEAPEYSYIDPINQGPLAQQPQPPQRPPAHVNQTPSHPHQPPIYDATYHTDSQNPNQSSVNMNINNQTPGGNPSNMNINNQTPGGNPSNYAPLPAFNLGQSSHLPPPEVVKPGVPHITQPQGGSQVLHVRPGDQIVQGGTTIIVQQAAETKPSMVGHIAFSCFVFWCCNWIFGGIAFFLAIAGMSSTVETSKKLGRASLGLNIAGIIITVIIIGALIGVFVTSASTNAYNYNYWSSTTPRY